MPLTWRRSSRVSSHLLYAVARAESDLQPGAVNLTQRARTGTYDSGLMQINSSHLPKLDSLGISESDLLEPCTNIKVGAWLLADFVRSVKIARTRRQHTIHCGRNVPGTKTCLREHRFPNVSAGAVR